MPQAIAPEIARSERVTFRLRVHERKAIEKAAELERMQLGEWTRKTLLARAQRLSRLNRKGSFS